MRALITGGTSGIGKAIVERLVTDGASVAFTGRDEQRGREVAAGGATFVRADARKAEEITRSVDEAVSALGGLDLVVLNAGVNHDALLSETTDEDWDTVLETNLLAPDRYAVACLPVLREAGGGSIVAISSDAGVWAEADIGAYSVSKRALNWLVQMLAIEAGPAGIRVNAVCPGDIAPGMRASATGEVRSSDTGSWVLPPLRRIGSAEDVASVVAFLASDDAAFVNGALLLADGGMRASMHAAAPRVLMATYGLSGRNALVTGGSSGIGKAIVERLAEEGMTVSFTGRNSERGEAVAAATGASFLPCDHLDRKASDEAVQRALRLGGGRLDVLVANAGMIFGGPIETTPDQAFRELVEINLTALFRVSRACFGPMREQGGGSMIHIASDTGVRGIHLIAAYSVTKGGAVAVSELFAADGAPYGIRSNAVCPGDVVPGVQATPAGHEEHAENPEGWRLPPSGRFGTGEDVANLVAWLASDESAHMTGAMLRIDGAAGAVFRAPAASA